MSSFLDFAKSFGLPPADAGAGRYDLPPGDDLLLHLGIDGFRRQMR